MKKFKFKLRYEKKVLKMKTKQKRLEKATQHRSNKNSNKHFKLNNNFDEKQSYDIYKKIFFKDYENRWMGEHAFYIRTIYKTF